jgi:outer membrane protein OmpA-like peptidoglycan-associated protein
MNKILLSLLFSLFVSTWADSTFVDKHFEKTPPHFCYGVGANAGVFRGGLHGKSWYNDRFGASLKLYGDWKHSGLGGLVEVLAKAPVKSPLKPYISVGGGYHMQKMDTTLNGLPFKEWIGMRTFHLAGGGEYRFGDEQAHSVSLEGGFIKGEADYSRSISNIGDDSQYADTNHFEMAPLSITALYTYYFCRGSDPEKDSDGDGIIDSEDKCRFRPEDKDGFMDEDGCPEKDNDNDGIDDVDDKCPMVPEDEDDFMDEDGCPEYDNDEDGIADSVDACPNIAENVNGFKDDDGCEDTPVVVSKKPIILDGVNFESGSDVITKDSYDALNNVAESFLAWPDVKIEIQGHTDSVGGAEGNMSLSKKRAIAILNYLVKRGVGAERLVAVGYGEDQPIDDNATKEGRSINRRVELKEIE